MKLDEVIIMGMMFPKYLSGGGGGGGGGDGGGGGEFNINPNEWLICFSK